MIIVLMCCVSLFVDWFVCLFVCLFLSLVVCLCLKFKIYLIHSTEPLGTCLHCRRYSALGSSHRENGCGQQAILRLELFVHYQLYW